MTFGNITMIGALLIGVVLVINEVVQLAVIAMTAEDDGEQDGE